MRVIKTVKYTWRNLQGRKREALFEHPSVILTNGNEFDQVVFILFITYQVVRSGRERQL